MKIFLDANVLVAVLNKEYPLFTYASRILSLSDSKRFQLFTSPICLAIAFYFAEKKTGTMVAGKKIAVLVSHLKIAPVSRDAVLKTIANKQISDFEDGLEYYSAVDSGCEVIITEDKGDFYFSGIEVVGCREFVERGIF